MRLLRDDGIPDSRFDLPPVRTNAVAPAFICDVFDAIRYPLRHLYGEAELQRERQHIVGYKTAYRMLKRIRTLMSEEHQLGGKVN